MFRKGLEEEIKEKRKHIVKQTEDENDKEIEISRHLFKQVLYMGVKLIKEFDVTVNNLEDIEVLERKRNVLTLDSKVDRLLGKSIEFRSIMPANYKNKNAE